MDRKVRERIERNRMEFDRRRRRDREYREPMYGDYDEPYEYDSRRRRRSDGMYPYGYGMEEPSRYDYRMRDGISDKELEKEYHETLENWIDNLKPKDKFKLSMDQVIQQARNIGVRFDEITEKEFYAVYLAHISDYKSVNGDYMTFIKMAKDFFEDADIKVTPSEKVYIYLYNIVLGVIE